MIPAMSEVVAEFTATDDPEERARASGRITACCAWFERTDSRCHGEVREALARQRDGRNYGLLTATQDAGCMDLIREIADGPACEHGKPSFASDCCCAPICGNCGGLVDLDCCSTQNCGSTGLPYTCEPCHRTSGCREESCWGDPSPHETEIR